MKFDTNTLRGCIAGAGYSHACMCPACAGFNRYPKWRERRRRQAPVIDAHCHYGPGDGLNGPWDTRADLTKFLRWADESGIERINLFAAFHSDYRAANRMVARLVRQHPERFSGFGGVKGPDRYLGADWETVEGAQLLSEAPTAFACTVEEMIDRATHSIVIGRIRAIRTKADAGALIYWNGQYRSLS